MYTPFPNIHNNAICTLENGPAISIGKIQNCQIMVKKWKKKGKFRPKMKKMRCHEKMKKKKNKNGSGQAAFIKN